MVMLLHLRWGILNMLQNLKVQLTLKVTCLLFFFFFLGATSVVSDVSRLAKSEEWGAVDENVVEGSIS